MKIYKNKYRNHWISPYTILEWVLFWREVDYDDPVIERWSDRLTPVCQAVKWIADRVSPEVNYIHIDYWDTWSMDHTLADIVLPMLRQLKATKHGAPLTQDEDVPQHLRSTAAPPRENEWDIDDNHFRRWDWILDEMIWAFEQKVLDDADSQFFDFSEADQVAEANLGNFARRLDKIRYDKEGHQAWQQRKDNGFRLFGRYYEALWD